MRRRLGVEHGGRVLSTVNLKRGGDKGREAKRGNSKEEQEAGGWSSVIKCEVHTHKTLGSVSSTMEKKEVD